jgi:hypothetical protein
MRGICESQLFVVELTRLQYRSRLKVGMIRKQPPILVVANALTGRAGNLELHGFHSVHGE